MPDSSINWGSVADWVSGFGSLAASGVALHLARASEKIRLKGHVGLRVVIGGGISPVNIVSISVTNVGRRATVVNGIGISVGRFKSKRHGFVPPPSGAYSASIPCPLADGQLAQWCFSNGDDKKWLRELCQKFIESEDDVRSLRFHIHTNHGDPLTLKPEVAMLDALRSVLSTEMGKPTTSTT